MVLEGDEVVRLRRGAVDVRHEGHGGPRAVLRDRDPVELGQVADLLPLPDPAGRGDVGVHDVDGVPLEEGEEPVPQHFLYLSSYSRPQSLPAIGRSPTGVRPTAHAHGP